MEKSIHELKAEFVYLVCVCVCVVCVCVCVCVYEKKINSFDITAIIFKAYKKCKSPRCSVRKGILRNISKFTGKHTCVRDSLLIKFRA